jgi:mannose-6-phosphate isomerase-like protein (cupin superfamily)
MSERTVHLPTRAAALPGSWSSVRLARIGGAGGKGGANLKVLRMDEAGFVEEVHDYDEAILVVDGRFRLGLGDEIIELGAGDFFVIPAGVPHRGEPGGSQGTLMIFDP